MQQLSINVQRIVIKYQKECVPCRSAELALEILMHSPYMYYSRVSTLV